MISLLKSPRYRHPSSILLKALLQHSTQLLVQAQLLATRKKHLTLNASVNLQNYSEKKPLPVIGKVWVPLCIWTLQDPPSAQPIETSFEEIVLNRIKGPIEKPAKTRRKVHMRSKIITDQEYLDELKQQEAEAEEKKVKTANRKQAALARKEIKFEKKKKKAAKFDDGGESDEAADELAQTFLKEWDEAVEESRDENEEEENEEASDEEERIDFNNKENERVGESDEYRLLRLWEDLSPPTPEDDIIGKWFGVIYTGKKSYLYIGKVTRRFLQDVNGPTSSLEIDCLKLQAGNSTVLESVPLHLPRDIFVCPLHNVIAGPLTVVPLKGDKWNIPEYGAIKKRFNEVIHLDRESMVQYLK